MKIILSLQCGNNEKENQRAGVTDPFKIIDNYLDKNSGSALTGVKYINRNGKPGVALVNV